MKSLTQEQVAAFLQRCPNATEYEPMAKHTSFRVGGAARLYYAIHTKVELDDLLSICRELSIPFFIYGGGSNLLVADKGYEGLVIQMAFRGLTITDNLVTADAGVITGLVARQSVDAGLGGFEWAVGVPGTIGGAIYGNAGCYGGEMKDVVERVHALRLSDGEQVVYTNSDCQFGYRESRFKHEPHIILQVELRLPRSSDVAASKERLQWVMNERKAKQPLGESSAGCAFKNWDFKNDNELTKLKQEVTELPQAMVDQKRLSAGWLIQQAGLLGKQIGEVSVSEKHGNFLVNQGHATAEDIITLIAFIKTKIRNSYGIQLQEEVQLLGFE